MAAVVPLLLVAATAAPVSALTSPWISVDKVMVNKLGGVNVSGLVDCSAAVGHVVDTYDVDLEAGDELVLSANSDNYTVSQPAGRKTMIQVQHGSSRMTPCYSTLSSFGDGSPVPCDPSGSPCRWETDRFGYERDVLGPLFDYSEDGTFKAGDLNVSAESIGLLIYVQRVADGSEEYFFEQEGTYATTSTIIRAVRYR